MAAGAADIATVRRRVAEPALDGDYGDAVLAQMIEAHPLPDGAGVLPDANDWKPTYDLWGAAADVWAEKASMLAGGFDFSADGASYSRSQAYMQARKQAAFCASRAAAKGVAF